ncbi:MAG: hypothetical protein LBU57_04745 [Dysgonamonadaceae bacterium]|jgi:hypothetical protein|nr:hypothetical protein [Dysgonamonadaceae bacterium]
MNMPETKDKLKELFHEIKMEKPSEDFMKNLMLRIEKKVTAQKKRKVILSYLSIAAGIACIIFVPALIIYFLKIEITPILLPNIFSEVATVFKNFSINPNIVGLGLVVLLLLLGDSVFRKYFVNGKQ